VQRTLVLRDQLTAGLVAGLAGGVVVDAFLLTVQVAGGKPLGDAVADTYGFIASVAFPAA